MPAAGAAVFWKAVAVFLVKAAIAYAVYVYTKPDIPFGPQQEIDVGLSRRDSDAPWRIVYGKARIGGVYIMAAQFRDSLRWMSVVLAFTGHPIESFGDFYINDSKMVLTGDMYSDAGATPAAGAYADKIIIRVKDGHQTSTWQELVDLSDYHFQLHPADERPWGTNHICYNRAIAWIEVDLQSDEFAGGLPNFAFEIEGHDNVFDPRSGGSYGYTDNAALCTADYIASDSYGVGGGYTGNIHETTLIAAANLSDEVVAYDDSEEDSLRYTCNGVLLTDRTRGENLGKLLSTMGATLTNAEGLWYILPAVWRAPTISFDESDLVAPVTLQPRLSRRELFNAVKGLFIDKKKDNVEADYPPYTNSTYATEDGETIWTELNFPMTNTHEIAQRLAKVHLERARQQIVVNFPGKLSCYQAQVGDVVELNLDRFGWTDKPFEVINIILKSTAEGEEIAPVMSCELQLRETAEAVFDWSLEETEQDPEPDTNLGDFTEQEPPTDLVLLSNIITVVWPTPMTPKPAIVATWVAPDPIGTLKHYEINYKPTAQLDLWFAAPEIGRNETEALISEHVFPQTYDVRIRAVNFYGYTSEWVEDTVVVSSLDVIGSPVNLLYGGGFKNPWDWSVLAASPTKLLPDAHVGSDYTDPALSYNDNEADYAYGIPAAFDRTLLLQGFGTGSGVDLGYFEVLQSTVILHGGSVQFYYKHDLIDWTRWAAAYGSTHRVHTLWSPVLQIDDLSTLEGKVVASEGSHPSSSVASRIMEWRWQSLPSGNWGQITDGTATIQGDGSSSYGYVQRPFPGRDPLRNVILFAPGAHSVYQLWAYAPSGAPTHDLEIVLYDEEADDDIVVVIIPKEDIVTGWYAFAANYRALVRFFSSYHWKIRTLSTNPIMVTNAMVNRGHLIFPWTPNPEEQGFFGDEPLGTVGDWDLGAWVYDADGRYHPKKAVIIP